MFYFLYFKNQVVTSIGFVLLRRNGRNCSLGFNDSQWACLYGKTLRDCLSFVSGSGLREPVLLMLRVIVGWLLRGLGVLRKKVSVRGRCLNSVCNNLISVIFVCITNLFSETQVLLRNIYEHLFCYYWFYAPPDISIYRMYLRAHILYWLPNYAVNLYVTRVCFVQSFYCCVCYSPFYCNVAFLIYAGSRFNICLFYGCLDGCIARRVFWS